MQEMKSDWSAFTVSVPWFVKEQQAVTTVEGRPFLKPSAKFEKTYPELSDLIRRARVTGITIDSDTFNLLTWESDIGSPMGWLTPLAGFSSSDRINEDHRLLLSEFGGILERFNEPDDTWLLNHDDVLTQRLATNDASFISDYQWAFEDAGAVVPITLSDYYTIAREANGNTTLCHRDSGDVVLFATDHAFDHITPLNGCPEYTLYTIDEASTLVEWVERVATQWKCKIEEA